MSAASQLLDAERPWPGLGSYEEANQVFFKGREAETEKLARLVEREILTVLYGRSGLGKTSLVQAGLFPFLRRMDYLPVRVHLVIADDAAGLRRQIGAALARECGRRAVEAPAYGGDESLWEYFFRKDGEFWSADDRLLTPLLFFDQFEELFTLGQQDLERRQRCEALLAELGEVVENRRPAAFRARLDAEPGLAAAFDDRRPPPKLLFSFREDYLADFDNLGDYLRARTSNRLRLLPMPGGQAAAAMVAASPEHLAPEVAEQVVRFIDPSPRPLDQLGVEPALLSLVCQKLNERRIERGEAWISADLLKDGSAAAVLERFYEEAFAGLDPRVRDFVEERLLTASGHRDSCALDNALATPGVDQEALRTLTDRRLLRREDRGGQVRFELIHDVLTGVAQASRKNRREKDRQLALRRRQRRIALALLAGTLALVFFALWTWKQSRAASGQVSQVLADYARKALEDGQVERAARLAAVASREGPLQVADPTAAPTLAAAAHHSSLAFQFLAHEGRINSFVFSPDGARLLTAGGDHYARMWDASNGVQILAVKYEAAVVEAFFDSSGERVVSRDRAGNVKIWNAGTGSEIGSWKLGGPIRGARFDASLERVVSWDEAGNVRVQDARTGAEIAGTRHDGEAAGAIFDRAGKRVLSWDVSGRVRIWSAETGGQIASTSREGPIGNVEFDPSGDDLVLMGPGAVWNVAADTWRFKWIRGGAFGAHFDVSGKRVVSWGGRDHGVEVWDAVTGADISAVTHEAEVVEAIFDSSGSRILSWSSDGTVKVWAAATGTIVAATQHPSRVFGAIFDRDGRRVLSMGWDDARVWDAATDVVLVRIRHEARIAGGSFAPRGDRVYTWDDTGIVRVGAIESLFLPSAPQPRIDFTYGRTGRSPDGRLAWDFGDQALAIREVDSGREIASLKHPEKVLGAIFDRRGKRVVFWDAPGVVRLWDLAGGAPIVLSKEGGSGAAFDAMESRILSWSASGSLRVSDGLTGVTLASAQHDRGIRGAKFDLSGKGVLVQDDSGDTRVWDVSWTEPRESNRELIDEVCARKLVGPEWTHGLFFVNGASVRRISAGDAQFAPILRDRVGEDVCASWGRQRVGPMRWMPVP